MNYSFTYKELVLKRKQEYLNWKPVYCKAIRDNIHFNMRGFNHLRFKTDNTPRNQKESLYKLMLLPLAKPVIYKSLNIHKYSIFGVL